LKPLTSHHTIEKNPDIQFPDTHQDTYSLTTLGFWTYLMTDCLLFATLFVTYAVLQSQTFGGPSSKELFKWPLLFVQTMLLLLSSLTCGLTLLSAVQKREKNLLFWLTVTLFLGLSFIILEFSEFRGLIQEGASFTKSAFLSSFFTLVGTHGLHVISGLLWGAVLIFQLVFQGITEDTFRRLVLFGLFWHFLDLVWIFVFTLVYLTGMVV
jgi:cytochrome o ubiquinol oxidase subunit 3